MSEEGAKSNEESKKEDPWAWLTRTWVGQVFSLIVLVTAPLAFVEARGFVWTFMIAAVATGFWWWRVVFSTWKPQALPESPPQRMYSSKWIALSAMLPLSLTLITVFLLFYDISQLNIWRRDYPSSTVVANRYGYTSRFFGDIAPRSTPEEREEYERSEWIRWMESGAQQATKKGHLLFVESETFSKRYHTFSVEFNDLSKQVRPSAFGVAFLVRDRQGDAWKRKTFRQVPCDFAGDGGSATLPRTRGKP